MTLICRLLGHVPLNAHYRVEERQFALCMRCGSDLVRCNGAEWRPLGGEGAPWTRATGGFELAAKPQSTRSKRNPPRRHAVPALLQRGYELRVFAVFRKRDRTAPEAVERPAKLPERTKAKRQGLARSYRRWWLMHRDPHRGESL